MVQGYYTLQEAAKFLGMPTESLKQMAQKGQIRSFQDRGTLRFRIQDIQEQARLRGAMSDPEQALGEPSLPSPKAPPSSTARKASAGPKTPSKQKAQNAPDVFAFDFDEENVNVAADIVSPGGGSKSKTAPKSARKMHTPAKPPPGSDSDVRLVADGSDVTFSVQKDSDIKLADSSVKISQDPGKPKTGMHGPTSGKRSSKVALGSGVQHSGKASSPSKPAQASPRPGSGAQPVDSGVRLVPMDSDSDVKILGASDEVPLGDALPLSHTDSNVRLDRVQLPPVDSQEGNMMQTEEINLDEELRKLEESGEIKKSTKMKAKSALKLPTSSPFELSETDLEMPPELAESSGPKTPRGKTGKDSSSDFDLQPLGLAGEEESDFSLDSGEIGEHALQQDGSANLSGPSSGISLNNPVDAGISLEEAGAQSDDAMDFDLSLEVEATPKPTVPDEESSDSDFQLKVGDTPRPVEASPADSESEFELSLDSDGDSPASQGSEESDLDLSLDVDSGENPKLNEDSEFELNLEASGEGDQGQGDSSSEFELTLDDSGNAVALDAEEEAPQVKSKKKGATSAKKEEEDIFDADFEVPSLDDSAEATVQDSELESSDFDLALDDSELAPEEESGSQVVALDEEDSATVEDSDDAAVVDDVEVEEESSDFGDLDADVEAAGDEEEVEVEDEDEDAAAPAGKTKTVIKDRLVQPAPWGVMPVIFMLPCVVVMFLVGILGYELMQTTANLKAPGPLTLAIAEMLGNKITVK